MRRPLTAPLTLPGALLGTLLGVVLTTAQPAGASHLSENLRDLTPSDICPLEVTVNLDDARDEDFETLIRGALERYTTAQGLTWGDPETCYVTQQFTLDAYQEDDGTFAYVAELALRLDGPYTVKLGERPVKLTGAELWSSVYYGTYADNLQDIAQREGRDMLEEFAAAWKATRPR